MSPTQTLTNFTYALTPPTHQRYPRHSLYLTDSNNLLIAVCLHETQNEISFHLEKIFCLHQFLLRAEWNKINFCFDFLICYLYVDEIFACADVFFMITSFPGSVYIIFITQNENFFWQIDHNNKSLTISFISWYSM